MNSEVYAVIVMGLPGTGKTYFAKRLADKIKAVHLGSDQLRMKLISERTYSTSEKTKIYEQLLTKTLETLSSGQSVVADATFYLKSFRKKFISEVSRLGIYPRIILIQASEQTVRDRIRLKRQDSEADFLVYKQVRDLFEPVSENKLVLDTDSNSIEECIDKALKYLKNG